MMSKFFFIITLTFLIFSQVSAETCENKSDDLFGSWVFYKFFYQGEDRPPINPNLILTFDFYITGSSRISWSRKNDPGFCERIGRWSFQNCKLTDTVVWVNPDNAVECSKDPDMQLNTTRTTPLKIENGELKLFLNLGEEDLIYIFKKK